MRGLIRVYMDITYSGYSEEVLRMNNIYYQFEEFNLSYEGIDLLVNRMLKDALDDKDLPNKGIHRCVLSAKFNVHYCWDTKYRRLIDFSDLEVLELDNDFNRRSLIRW